MKIAIISDMHLLDTFDEEKFKYIESVVKSHDRLIINGDLWEGQIISFDQFLNSEWSRLFPLFKEKHTVSLYGNHDKKSMIDERFHLYADEMHEEYELPLENSNKVLHLIHGDQFVNYPFTYYRTHPVFLKSVAYPNRLRISFEDWLGSKIGWKKAKFFKMQRNPQKLIDIANSERYRGKILVTSHSHDPYFLPKMNFINTGMILSHLASYLSINDGNMKLIKETY